MFQRAFAVIINSSKVSSKFVNVRNISIGSTMLRKSPSKAGAIFVYGKQAANQKTSTNPIKKGNVKKKETNCSTVNAKAALECTTLPASVCPKFCMPDCRRARIPPKCEKFTEQKDCQKLLAPEPSFSECYRLQPRQVKLC